QGSLLPLLFSSILLLPPFLSLTFHALPQLGPGTLVAQNKQVKTSEPHKEPFILGRPQNHIA
ncbi:MAG TPA: hypothetical protein PKM72_13200, partial [Nitrospirales bacterium]|nr:hypothetical protein [Nitrospirales bacterium]